MQIRRINDNLIECFLSTAEMKERGIAATDFQTPTQKAQDFVDTVINEAKEKVGFRSDDNGLQKVSIIANPFGMAVYLMEDGTMDDLRTEISKLRKHAKKIFRDVEENTEEFIKEEELFDEDEFERDEYALSATELETLLEENDGSTKLEDLLYEFASLSSVITLAQAIPVLADTSSSLYKYQGMFYIHLQMGDNNKKSTKEYFAVGSTASESGGKLIRDAKQRTIIGEYGECLIKDGALNKLACRS